MQLLKPGDIAPDFTLFNDHKQTVTLSEIKDKHTVLVFFPLAFTSVCTVELCALRDGLKEYQHLNAVVLGISVDSLHSLAKYKAEQNLNFDLLSDFNKEVSINYGCLYESFSYGMKGVSKRSVFVIDKSGVIRYVEILENAGELPNFAEVKRILSTLDEQI
jgi:glutaredoxin-dependent peroxiredoxin